MSSLKQKSVVGVAWSLSEQFGTYAMKFVIGIILARLLNPDDFGLVGMIFVFFAVAEQFVKSGFGAAYVQKKEATDLDANTIFFTNLVISIILYVILYLGAPLIAQFYDQSALIVLTRVMGLVIVINAFNVIQQAKITRAVNFKRKAKITLVATLISGSSGITAAYMGLGVWALVIQSLTNRAMIGIGLWVASRWKPKWQFSINAFREMFAYGAWVLFSSVIRKILDNIYILAIGKFFPAEEVGFYTKSRQLQVASSQNLALAIGGVAFPTYARIQDDKERLRHGMRNFLQFTMLFLVPLVIGLIVVAEPFVIILIKEKWAPMIPYLQLICVLGILYPIHMVNIQSIAAQGKARLSFNLELFQGALRLLNIALMYRFGVIYIIMGEIIVSLISLIVKIWFAKRLVAYGFWKQINHIRNIMMGGIIAGMIGYLPHLFYSNHWILLISGSVLVSVTYLVYQYLFNKQLLVAAIQLKNYFRK